MSITFDLHNYQDEFLFTKARYPCIISGVGTGKTAIGLVQAWNHCEQYPGALAMVVRKEFTDLRDSTMSDFTSYFGVKPNAHNEYTFPNKSKILFRHGNENDLAVLKNINLSYALIEQAEEYENGEVFNFLRDRLRRSVTPIRQMAIIANAKGRNWCWDLFINKAKQVIDFKATVNFRNKILDTGEFFYKRDEYECWTANSWVNSNNLPADTVEDWMTMEEDAPNHYQQMIMNSFDQLDDDDMLLTSDDINQALRAEFLYNKDLYSSKIMAVDIARYGNDTCDMTLLEQRGPMHWEQTIMEEWKHKDLMYSTGKIQELRARFRPNVLVVDGEGMGAGVVDRLKELEVEVVEYRGGMVDGLRLPDKYVDHNADDAFYMKEKLIQGSRLKIRPEVMAESQTVRYKYMSNGKKRMVSKEEMRNKGIKSPNKFDSLKMACSQVENRNVHAYQRKRQQPRKAKPVNPWSMVR